MESGSVANREETPQQNPTGPGTETVVVSKIDIYGMNATAHHLHTKIGDIKGGVSMRHAAL